MSGWKKVLSIGVNLIWKIVFCSKPEFLLPSRAAARPNRERVRSANKNLNSVYFFAATDRRHRLCRLCRRNKAGKFRPHLAGSATAGRPCNQSERFAANQASTG